MGRAKPPPILDATPEQIEHMLNVARQQMPAELFAIIEASVVTNAWLIAELRKQKASLRRLRKLMGINSSEKDAQRHSPIIGPKRANWYRYRCSG